MSDKKKNESSPFAGALADKLKDLDVDTSARSNRENEQQAEDESASKDTSSKRQAHSNRQASREHSRQDEPELSDEELFLQAFQNVDREAIERAHQSPPRNQAGEARPSVERDQEVDRDSQVEDKPAHPAQREQAQREQAQKPLSERDLFEKAVQELDPADVYSGKFHGVGPELPPEPEEEELPESDSKPDARPLSEEEAREAVAEKREIRQFERAIGPVDKKNVRRQKYRERSKPVPEEHVKQVASSYRSDSPDDMITPPLPKSGEGLNNVGPLTGAQKDMLARYKKRSRRREVPEINVRGDTVDDALRQIELFIHQQWKEKAHFVRIIHGRGLQSDGDPVLKPAVLRFLEGPGYRYIKGYVPEVNSARDYGSVIAELTAKEKE